MNDCSMRCATILVGFNSRETTKRNEWCMAVYAKAWQFTAVPTTYRRWIVDHTVYGAETVSVHHIPRCCKANQWWNAAASANRVAKREIVGDDLNSCIEHVARDRGIFGHSGTRLPYITARSRSGMRDLHRSRPYRLDVLNLSEGRKPRPCRTANQSRCAAASVSHSEERPELVWPGNSWSALGPL